MAMKVGMLVSSDLNTIQEVSSSSMMGMTLYMYSFYTCIGDGSSPANRNNQLEWEIGSQSGRRTSPRTKCGYCNGEGGMWMDTGYYTGSGNVSWITCPRCHGRRYE